MEPVKMNGKKKGKEVKQYYKESELNERKERYREDKEKSNMPSNEEEKR